AVSCSVSLHDALPIWFAELSIRNYAEDCVTDRVAYLEGWYVVPEWRRRGVGGALVAAAESWAQGQGCTEFASDTPIDNLGSEFRSEEHTSELQSRSDL